jgi:hypothetical protein
VLEQLPRLFDRNFLLGYFVPVTIFIGTALGILAPLRGIKHIILGIERDPSLGLIYAIVLIIIVSYVLVSVNRLFIEFLEGFYFPLHSISWLKSRQLRRRQRLANQINQLEQILISTKSKDPEAIVAVQREWSRKQQTLTTRFPPLYEDVQPTRFGNVLRAFEAYSIDMYGIDINPGWYHLLEVIGDSSEQRILSDKTMVDFYLNLFLLSFAMLPLIIIRALHDVHVFTGVDWMEFAFAKWWQPIAFIGALVLASVFYNGAIAAALVWGARVKATFDVYIDDLARKLGYEPPISKADWAQISRAFIYREQLPPKKVSGTPARTPP